MRQFCINFEFLDILKYLVKRKDTNGFKVGVELFDALDNAISSIENVGVLVKVFAAPDNNAGTQKDLGTRLLIFGAFY